MFTKISTIYQWQREKCVDHLIAIITHHCGNHDLSLDFNFRIIQKENPIESDATHKNLYAQSSRYGGQNISLTNDGIETLTKVIMKRFNEKSLEKLAMLPCVSYCEWFFGLTTKYSEVKKRLHHKDLWRNMLLHVVNITSDPFNIHEKYASHLNIQTSKKEQLHMKQRQTKLKKYHIRLNSPTGKKEDYYQNEKRWYDKNKMQSKHTKLKKISMKESSKI